MNGNYRIERHPNAERDWWLLYHHNGNLLASLTSEDLAAFHLLSGEILGCSDENCHCHEAGRQKGLEMPREPYRSRA